MYLMVYVISGPAVGKIHTLTHTMCGSKFILHVIICLYKMHWLTLMQAVLFVIKILHGYFPLKNEAI